MTQVPEFWYGRAKIPVKKNYTLGSEKKISKKSQKNFFFKVPEFWYGRAKIPVKKNYILGYEKINQKIFKKV